MTTHVFVVDSTTFKLHLEYMFAGTGAKDKTSPFILNSKAACHHSTERGLVGMIADISRVRPGDKIIFYLQATTTTPGMFFGVFKAESVAFFDENDGNNYLKSELDKGLSFRIKISPDKVYAYGITEHEYLDDLAGKSKPSELCWSMIYRKLKGNRGCTMITKYEYEDLLYKLDNKNNHVTLSGQNFSYDSVNTQIMQINDSNQYAGREESLDIKNRLLYKSGAKKAFETHLQAYVMQNFDKPILSNYLLTLNNGNCWIGNEVSCGVGMQRIDALIVEESDMEIHLKIIEMKDEEPLDYIIDDQLPWYIYWVSQYLVPNLLECNKLIIIHPCILAKDTANQKIIERIKKEKFKISPIINVSIAPTEYIAFSITNNDINFIKVV